jgi:hypothetical protein
VHRTDQKIDVFFLDQLVGQLLRLVRLGFTVDIDELDRPTAEHVAGFGKAQHHGITDVRPQLGIGAGIWQQNADLDLGLSTDGKFRWDK